MLSEAQKAQQRLRQALSSEGPASAVLAAGSLSGAASPVVTADKVATGATAGHLPSSCMQAYHL